MGKPEKKTMGALSLQLRDGELSVTYGIEKTRGEKKCVTDNIAGYLGLNMNQRN